MSTILQPMPRTRDSELPTEAPGLATTRHPRAKILVVDDDPAHVRLLTQILRTAGYRRVRAETDPRRALERFMLFEPDLVVLDLNMPGIDGMEVLDRLNAHLDADEYLPVLIITGDPERDTRSLALARGARDFVSKPFDMSEVLLRVGNLVETRMLHRTLAQQVAVRTRQLEESRDITLLAVAKLAESRDPETGRHLERIAEYSRLLARTLSSRPGEPAIDREFVECIHRASILHDIGKVGIPDAILRKPGPLSAEERALMKEHASIGGDTLSQAIAGRPGHQVLDMAAEIAYQHHERWDGTGYPRGLARTQISPAARIVALVDAYDAMTTARPYKLAMRHHEARFRIVCDRGRHFDPAVVDGFLAVEHEIDAIRRAFAAQDEAHLHDVPGA